MSAREMYKKAYRAARLRWRGNLTIDDMRGIYPHILRDARKHFNNRYRGQ
jgi:hypothetical protein